LEGNLSASVKLWVTLNQTLYDRYKILAEKRGCGIKEYITDIVQNHIVDAWKENGNEISKAQYGKNKYRGEL